MIPANPVDHAFELVRNEWAHGRPVSPLDVVKAIRSSGGTVGVEELRSIMTRLGRTSGPVLVPPVAAEFITAFAMAIPIRSVLDPWAGTGILLAPLAMITGAESAVGISMVATEHQIATEVWGLATARWVIAEPIQWLAATAEKFDFVTGIPPVGMHPVERQYHLDDASVSVRVRDDLGHVAILEACLHLAERGTAALVVSPKFVAPQKPASVYSVLPRFGFHVQAAISLPTRSFAPHSLIDGLIVIIGRERQDRLFVGELSEEPRRRAILLENLKARKPGKELRLGGLVDPKGFRSYRSLQADRRTEEGARGLGLRPQDLQAISIEVTLGRREPPSFPDRSNAVYLPLIGRSPAVSSVSELKLAPHNYAQIVMDPEKAIAEYVAGFFNTTLGLLVRESALSGTFIPKITRSTLDNVRVYLPDVAEQIRSIDANTTITNLMSQLKELQSRVWSQPRRLDQVLKELQRVNRDEGFTGWVDTLPFPLASILWAYEASDNDKDRYEHLLHFFEAMSEFLATVLLSGFSNDADLFAQEIGAIKRALSQNFLSLDLGTFGTWVVVAERLSKTGGTMFNGSPEQKAVCRALFRTDHFAVLDMLFSKEIIAVLQEANSLRNDWAGHGGIVTERLASGRHAVLSSHLAKIRAVLSDTWQSYELIMPGSSRFVSGTYAYRVTRVTGSRTPFPSVQVKVAEAMEDGYLHLLGRGEDRALKLLPLVKVMESPRTAQNASYFYNRRQGGRIRFVSYHFDPEAEVVEEFPDTASVLEMIERQMNDQV